MSLPSIPVHILHSDPVMAAGLGALLGDQSGLHLSAAAPGGNDGRGVALVVTDYDDALRRLAQRRERADGREANLRIVIVSSRVREQEVRRAIAHDAYAFVCQGCSPDELVGAVRSVASGRRFMSAAAAATIAECLARASLTRREMEVLGLLASGLCNKSIGNALDISIGTIKSHVGAILEKLGARTRTEAAAIAIERGLLADARPVAPRRRAGAPAPMRSASVGGLAFR